MNEIEFSQRLASYLNMNSEEPLHKIIKKLCSSLCGGSTVFIKIENWDSVIDKEKFLDWFIEKFWKVLVNELESIFQEYSRIRFIVALTAKSKVFPYCLSIPHFCTEDTFDSCKILELPLPDWTVEDIRNWLINFRGLSNSKSQQLALQIHQESEGTPDTICSILERDFKI
nr:hypothetical protein [Brasilonema octagenarum]